MSHQRFRSTSFLNFAIFFLVAGIGVGAIFLASGLGDGQLSRVIAGSALVLVLFSDWISSAIILFLTRHTEQDPKQSASLWFNDLAQEDQRVSEKFYEVTKDNPTLR